MARRAAALLGISLLASSTALAAPGFVSRPAQLLDRPAAGSRVVAQLDRRQPVEVLGREGSWVRLKSGNTTGWARLIDVRFNAPASTPVALPRVKPVADNGIRGFSEEELLAGTPGLGELERFNKLAVPAADAAEFARGAGLRARQQDYYDPIDFMSLDLPDDFFDE